MCCIELLLFSLTVARFHSAVMCTRYAALGNDQAGRFQRGGGRSFDNLVISQPICRLACNVNLLEEMMQRMVPSRFSWFSLSALVLAMSVFIPGEKMAAQIASSSSSPQAQEFTQNVKEVYFPFNVYT